MNKIETSANSSIIDSVRSRISDYCQALRTRIEFKKKWTDFFNGDFDSTKITVDDCLYLLEKGGLDDWYCGPEKIEPQKFWAKIFYSVFQNLEPDQQLNKKIYMQKNLPFFKKVRLIDFMMMDYKNSPEEFKQFTISLCSSFLVSTQGDGNSVRKFANQMIISGFIPQSVKFQLGIGNIMSQNKQLMLNK